MTTTSTDLLTSRKNLHETKFVETELPALKPGQALFKIDTFAFTANNVTYGAFGDAMMYWNFFPAPEGFGRVPVWGFADVVESNAKGVEVGERFWGYWPISTHLIVEPTRVTPHGFSDGAAHRQKMAQVYNSYIRAAADPNYNKERESERALLRPLFTTYNARVTFFISRYARLGPEVEDMVSMLAADGHDIAAHSVEHLRAPTYVEERGLGAYMRDEALPSIDVLREVGFDVTSFAYPFGARTSELDDALLEHVPVVRSVSFSIEGVPDPCPH